MVNGILHANTRMGLKMLGPDVLELKEFLYSLVKWSDVVSVLDVGCGSGHDLFSMSALAPHVKEFIGVDSSEMQIETAQRDERKTGRTSFLACDVSVGLPFENERFDLIFCNNLLECIPDKLPFLRELHRVLKRNGQFVCSHYDWDSQLFNGSNKELIRRAVHAFADWKQPWMRDCDAWMGRRLLSSIATTNLFAGEISTYVLTNERFESPLYGWARVQDFAELCNQELLSKADYDELIEDLTSAAARTAYFYSINMFAFSGKPIH